MSFALAGDPLADGRAHLSHILPRQRGLEGLRDEVVPEPKISQISDHEGKEVSSLSILCTSPEPLVLLRQLVDNGHLVLDLHR